MGSARVIEILLRMLLAIYNVLDWCQVPYVNMFALRFLYPTLIVVFFYSSFFSNTK